MALEGGEGSASRPDRSLPPGKTRYPLYRRLGGPQGRSGQVRKVSPPTGSDPRTVQPVASCYIDCATRPTESAVVFRKIVRSSTVVEWTSMAVGDLTGRSSTSRTDVNAAWTGGTDFGKRMSHSSRFIRCMGIVLCKCSQHGCEYKKPICTAKTFLNSCQDGTYASILSEIVLKNNDILWE